MCTYKIHICTFDFSQKLQTTIFKFSIECCYYIPRTKYSKKSNETGEIINSLEFGGYFFLEYNIAVIRPKR